MEKKIGILTFHKSLNYGSVLQAFALVQNLKNMGFNTEIIDYTQRNYGVNYSLMKAPFSLEAIKYDVIHFVFFPVLIKREKAFSQFRKKYLCLSKKNYQYGDNLEILSEMYDVLLCGSDQIWNPNARDFDPNFFLPFAKNTLKISYAVSINGGELNRTNIHEQIRENLMNFNFLSVRENSGKESLDTFLSRKKPISVVLDPTLLHQQTVYNSISSPRLIAEPYIFFYSINFADDAIGAAEILSERTGLPVYTLFAGRGNRAMLKMRGKIRFWVKSVGPEDFISLLKFANYVVTDSFHGTAFSIIYEKKFFSIASTDDKKEPIRDERICNILELFNISDRFVTKDQLYDFPVNLEINYAEVNRRRKNQINLASTYIKDSLTGRGDSNENCDCYSI